MSMISITDKPIVTISEDLLKVDRHAKALSDFILRSDTPLTIGLQGEWGSGKTSLMYLLREKLQSSDVATAWLNTWEYSLFRGAHETTPAVLQGLLVKLKDACGDQWTLNDEAKEKWRSVVRFAGALGNQLLANKAGIDAKAAIDEVKGGSSQTITDIAELKAAITDIIDRLIQDPKNDFKRVVFFVDDLDRINPADAVEVLEALKNVFDIPHCIFLLAIDYDVVVKGLEGKFGPKTEANEREFRSFFDKIIQLPFSMPTGTYDIEHFLASKLKDLGISQQAGREELFAKVVKYTVGYNPRSLKRYINSFSLLNSIRKLDEAAEEQGEETDEFMLFALLGIQISYPKIFRLLTASPNYLTWDAAFGAKHGLEWEAVLSNLSKYGESSLTDEDWERVVWGSCQSDAYLKSRVTNILELLNLLRNSFSDALDHQLEQAMAFAAITSVDDDMDTKQAVERSGKKVLFEGLEVKVQQLKERGIKDEGIELWRHLWDKLDAMAKADSRYRINFAKSACSFNDDSLPHRKRQQLYVVDPALTAPGYRIFVKKATGKTKELRQQLLDAGLGLEESQLELADGSLVLSLSIASAIGKERFKRVLDVILEGLGLNG
ncbi:MAG: hypothetical protein KDC02_07565 [Flavobacteriales bacterium]|nr:hypothetical protein [Flavobacteriales bacterium]